MISDNRQRRRRQEHNEQSVHWKYKVVVCERCTMQQKNATVANRKILQDTSQAGNALCWSVNQGQVKKI